MNATEGLPREREYAVYTFVDIGYSWEIVTAPSASDSLHVWRKTKGTVSPGPRIVKCIPTGEMFEFPGF